MALQRHLRGDLKRKLAKSELTFGSWITINHRAVVEIMSTAGFEWLCIDVEHSAIGIQDVANLIAHIQGNGMQALVRVNENNPDIIKRVMDAGAEGIIVPMICSAEEARNAVAAVRYPIDGKRGVGLSRAQNYGIGFDEYLDWLRKDSVIIAQIEHIEAIRNLEEIVSVEGLDGVIVGPYDLSASMGFPGEFHRDEVLDALKLVDEVCLRKGVPLGFHVISSDHNKTLDKVRAGYSFLAVSLDFFFLGDLARNEMAALKNALDK